MHIGQHSAYSFGMECNEQGILRSNNPFHYEGIERSAWFAGWDAFQIIRESWEESNYIAARRCGS